MLGCTHYCLLKDKIRSRVTVPVISQDEVIPAKLENYLQRHPEIADRLDRTGDRQYFVTDVTPGYSRWSGQLIGSSIDLQKVTLQ